MTTVKNYMHMNDETIQSQKRKYSPGDHLPTRMPGPKEVRRKGYRTKEPGRNQRKKRRVERSARKQHTPCTVKKACAAFHRMHVWNMHPVLGAAFSAEPSGDERFKPVRQVNQFELARGL